MVMSARAVAAIAACAAATSGCSSSESIKATGAPHPDMDASADAGAIGSWEGSFEDADLASDAGACAPFDAPGDSPPPRALGGVNSGLFEGALSIGGHVRDPSGQLVIGARIDLGGDAQGLRYSDFTGGYHFRVDPGSYALRASGSCLPTTVVPLGRVTADATKDFVATGPGCMTGTVSNVISTGEVIEISQGGNVVGSTGVNLEERCLPGPGCGLDVSVARLQQLPIEEPLPFSWLTIACRPAREGAGPVTSQGPLCPACGPATVTSLDLTTAIAVDNTVVFFYSQMAADAPQARVDAFLAAGRNFTPEEMPDLHGPPPDL